MAFASADRVLETSTTTGTGTYDLAGVVAGGYQTFVAGIGTGNTCYYTAFNGTDWEVGLGTVTDAATDTLARTTILQSSNADAAVNWGAGTKTIFCTAPALVLGMLVADGQIKFPATQNASSDANTLDDYEEGSFTPTLLFGGAATGMTYSYQAGRYTKIGNRVIFFLEIILTAKGSSTGTATITGLPFTNANIVLAPLAGFSTGMASLVDGFIGGVAANSATITCYTGSATGNAVATHAMFTDTSRIDLSGSIQV